MKEFETTFAKGLKKGLREDDENPRNQEALVECLNAKPTEEGLIPIVAVTTPMAVSMAWPFPQVFDRPIAASLCSEATATGYSGSDPLTLTASTRTNVTITNGLGPFTWTITGTDLSWASATTNGRTNTLIAGSSAIGAGSWTATDVCGSATGGDLQIPSSALTWGENTADDYTGVMADCLIYKAGPDNNYETYPGGEYLGMGRGGGVNDVNRSVIKFNIKAGLDALGANTIISATLYGYLLWDVTGDHNVSAYRLLQNWVEAQVTWNSFSTGNAWNTAGVGAASDAGTDDGVYDRLATAEDTIAMADGLSSGSYAFELDLTDLAQEWLDGTAKEYGVLLKSDNEIASEVVGLTESEGADTNRAYLEIVYI